MKCRKAISLILAMVMLVCVCFAGCAGQPAASSSAPQDPVSSEAASSEEPSGPDLSEAVDLTWYTYDANYEDEGVVLDAMNEILKEKLNASVTINRIAAGDYESKMGIMINSQEEFDI